MICSFALLHAAMLLAGALIYSSFKFVRTCFRFFIFLSIDEQIMICVENYLFWNLVGYCHTCEAL